MGICIPNFTTGSMLQLMGCCLVDYDKSRFTIFPSDTEAVMGYEITGVRELPPGTLPIRWSPPSAIAGHTPPVGKELIALSKDKNTPFVLKQKEPAFTI